VSSAFRVLYRFTNASISACIRALYSSDQWAPGFCLAFLSGLNTGGVLAELVVLVGGDLRAPAFSLSVGRGGEIVLFMRLGSG
jgi:hypothetical protein